MPQQNTAISSEPANSSNRANHSDPAHSGDHANHSEPANSGNHANHSEPAISSTHAGSSEPASPSRINLIPDPCSHTFQECKASLGVHAERYIPPIMLNIVIPNH